ncbi:MAG: hypothetical protein JWP11_3426 [Frankiales bacterium]|nr:hypothetical protein [Frankiales bacterium]
MRPPRQRSGPPGQGARQNTAATKPQVLPDGGTSPTSTSIPAGPAVSQLVVHDCDGTHRPRLSVVGRAALPIVLPQQLDEHAVRALELPPQVAVALHAPGDVSWRCTSLLLLAWRCVGRHRVEIHGFPAPAAHCFTDWLARAAAMDPEAHLAGVA